MPNGRNAGRLFADCFNEHGYGESHSGDRSAKEGDEIFCAHCGAKLLVKARIVNGKRVDGLEVERISSSLARRSEYASAQGSDDPPSS